MTQRQQVAWAKKVGFDKPEFVRRFNEISPAEVLALQSERDVTKTIIDFLKAEDWKVHRLQSGTVRGLRGGNPITLNPKGTPDWVALRACGPAGFYQTFYLEAKKPGGKLRPAQVAMHVSLRRDGFVVIVADSYDSFRRDYDARYK